MLVITRGYFIGEDSWNPWQPYFSDLPDLLPHGMIIFVKKPVGSLVNSAFLVAFGRGFPPKKKRKPLPRVLWCSGTPMFWTLKTGNQTAMCFLRKVSKVIVAIPASDWILFYSPYDLRYSNSALLRLLDPHLGWWKKRRKKNAPPIWLHERHCLNLPHYIPSHTKKESLPSS